MHTAAPADPEIPSILRESVPTDMPLVVDSWRRTWCLSSGMRRLHPDHYAEVFQRVVVDGVLSLPDTKILLWADSDDPDVILAWVCYTPGTVPTLHYAYTRAGDRDGQVGDARASLRRRGLMASLVAAMGVRSDGLGMVYTFRPQERPHRKGKHMGREGKLLDGAERRGIAVTYVPIRKWLAGR